MNPLDRVFARLGGSGGVTLGSDPNSDVVVGGRGVNSHHARIAISREGCFINDLDSATGTFVNDLEVRGRVALRAGDRLRIGANELIVPASVAVSTRTVAGDPGHFIGAGASIGVRDASKSVAIRANGRPVRKRILDAVSFQLKAGEFVGILGASGSGKSTLMNVLAGNSCLSEGQVLWDGVPRDAGAIRADRRVAYLPQDVVIHEVLTPAVALDYIAKLKGVGATSSERRAAVAAALGQVGLEDKRHVPIRRLSGGQRKRAALAAELLGDPSVLLLDEATSGLDPATEGEMMHLFKNLSRQGRTVVCITHFPEHLDLCDRILFMLEGQLVFSGAPSELVAFFGAERIEDVYRRQKAYPVAEWKRAFEQSLPGAVHAKQLRFVPTPVPAVDDNSTDQQNGGQTWDLTTRYARVQLADLRNFGLLFLQAPVIALLIGSVFGSIKVGFAELHAADSKQVIFLLVLSTLWCAGSSSVREVVKEQAIVDHEARFGLRIFPYLLSKLVFLGAVVVAQAFILLAVVRWFTDLTGMPDLQFAVISGVAIVGTVLGLLVSCVAGTSERAMTILPVILIGQAIFSGGLARLTGLPRTLAMTFSPAYWGMDGMKSTFSSDLTIATYPGAPGHYQPPILGQGGPIAMDIVALAVQATLLFTAGWFLVKRNAERK